LLEFYNKIYDAEEWMHEKFAHLSDGCGLNLNSNRAFLTNQRNLITSLVEYENNIKKIRDLNDKLLKTGFFKINNSFDIFLERWLALRSSNELRLSFLEKCENQFFADALIEMKFLLCKL